jgi:SPX domain protein involved in polyphosphate accumulation
MVDFIKPYCSYDKYSTLSADTYYKVNSLYFDTPEFLFLRKRLLKSDNRFNMRIRSYGDFPKAPYFLEIKQRRGDTIRKFRAQADDAFLNALSISEVTNAHYSKEEKDRKNQDLFCRAGQTYHANPVVLVQYLRKAFISDVDDYARVTFDRALRYMPQNSYSVAPDENKMVSCDVETCFDPGCSIILELKCYTSYVPLWMVDMIRQFQLRRRSFSKYSNCIKPVFDRYSSNNIFAREPAMCQSFFDEL